MTSCKELSNSGNDVGCVRNENNRLILSDEDKELHHKWKAAVKEKDFATADDYRARLIEKGIL